MNEGKWFQLRREDDPDELPYSWPKATRKMWKEQIKPRTGMGIRKTFAAFGKDIARMDPTPAIVVVFPRDYAMAGHLASIRKVFDNLQMRNFECIRNNVSMRTPGTYFGAGMAIVWTKYVLRKLAEASPAFQQIWRDLQDLPPGECGIYLADAPDSAWLASIRKDEPRLFEGFREARHLDMVGLDLSNPPGPAKALHDRAVEFLQAGERERGEALLEDLLDRWPDYWRAYVDLICSARDRDNLRQAYAFVRRAQARFPHSLSFDRIGADCASQRGDWRRAEWHLKRLWGLNPWDPHLMIRYARVAFEKQEYPLAAKLYEECAEHGPLGWGAQFNYGVTLGRINRGREALAVFKAMEKQDAKNVRLLNNIGLLLAGGGRPLEGLDYCRRALQMDPGADCVWDSLGFAYLKLKKYREARRAFLKAVELAPAFPDAWRHLLHAYYQDGDAERLESAKAYVARVLPGELARFEKEKGTDIPD